MLKLGKEKLDFIFMEQVLNQTKFTRDEEFLKKHICKLILYFEANELFSSKGFLSRENN